MQNLVAMKILSREDILSLPKYHRTSLINTMSGPRSGNLISTASSDGSHNLAVFNTVTHIGSNPPYLGFMMRPLTVSRHTYDNIKKRKYFTINPINTNIYSQAHQTSAKYDTEISEFEAVGLTPLFLGGFPIPFVEESSYGIGLSYQEECEIQANGTILMIGKVECIILPDDGLTEDMSLNHEVLGSVAVGGLDTYYKTEMLSREEYARPEKKD